jgi:hypothetical protein
VWDYTYIRSEGNLTERKNSRRNKMFNAYFIKNNEILCFDCGNDAECTNEQKNETGEMLTCTCCGQEIPFAGQQTYQARGIIAESFWDCLK